MSGNVILKVSFKGVSVAAERFLKGTVNKGSLIMGGRGEQQLRARVPGIKSCFHHQLGQVTHLSEPQFAHLYSGNKSMVALSIIVSALTMRAVIITIVTVTVTSTTTIVTVTITSITTIVTVTITSITSIIVTTSSSRGSGVITEKPLSHQFILPTIPVPSPQGVAFWKRVRASSQRFPSLTLHNLRHVNWSKKPRDTALQ